jgi:hypothetical protein
MGSPSNPIVRIATGIATAGGSEIVRAGSSAAKSLIGGENIIQGLDRDMSLKGRPDRISVSKDVLGSAVSKAASETESAQAATFNADPRGGLPAKGMDDTEADRLGGPISGTAMVAGAAEKIVNPEIPGVPPMAPPDDGVNRPAYDLAKKTAAAEEKKRLRSGSGRASTILTSGFGDANMPSGKRYLGSV